MRLCGEHSPICASPPHVTASPCGQHQNTGACRSPGCACMEVYLTSRTSSGSTPVRWHSRTRQPEPAGQLTRAPSPTTTQYSLHQTPRRALCGWRVHRSVDPAGADPATRPQQHSRSLSTNCPWGLRNCSQLTNSLHQKISNNIAQIETWIFLKMSHSFSQGFLQFHRKYQIKYFTF